MKKKIIIYILSAIIFLVISTSIVFYITDDIIIALCGSSLEDTYYFKLDRNGNLYSVGGSRHNDRVSKDKNWIYERGIETKLLSEDAKRLTKKVKEIYDLYYKYETDLYLTDAWEVQILYRNKFIRRFPYPYPPPYEHISGPQIQELIDILTEVAPFEIHMRSYA